MKFYQALLLCIVIVGCLSFTTMINCDQSPNQFNVKKIPITSNNETTLCEGCLIFAKLIDDMIESNYTATKVIEIVNNIVCRNLLEHNL